MSERTKALSEVLKIYTDTEEPISQEFYQGLCSQAIEQIKQLQAELAAVKESCKNHVAIKRIRLDRIEQLEAELKIFKEVYP